MESFLAVVAWRALDAAGSRPLPTDDALATLELHGAVCEIGAEDGVWGGLLRRRGLVHCVCYAREPSEDAFTHVLPGDENMAAHHTDRTLLLVRGGKKLDEREALNAFTKAGGKLMAHVGDLHAPDLASFTALLVDAFEKQVTVSLPAGDRLTIWKRKQPAASGSATAYRVLDVRLELVDMEAPDWANPPKDPPKPFEPVIGGRTVKPTMSREAMRKAFEESLPDGFEHESGDYTD